ncbi:MAG: hypothetical protein HKN91_01195 [Acidimicrobiia bacterium]|nr:hypothetical protein [Acidimicrobiia bacterium]
MRRLLFTFLSVLTAVALVAAPAFAVEADEVAAEAANTGFFVERGAGISESQAGDLVSEMRNAGEGFILVVLADEPPAGATTFADNVQFAIGRGLVLVIAPETVGYAGVGEFFNEDELETALDTAVESGGSDFELAATFVGELTGVPVTPVPVPTTASPATTAAPQAQAPESSGGGSGFLWFIIIAGGLGLLVWWMMKRSKAKREAATDSQGDDKLNKARYIIQEQLNDVANDILALEDEVRVADNDRANRFYETASQTYSDASDALPKANSAQDLLDLSNKLDVAIWQLDSAEAILDDQPLPERPEPKRLEPPPPDPSARPSTRTTVPAPSSYQRRSTRRSSFGGGGLMDLLIAVGGGMLANQSRSTSSRSSGGLSGGLGDLFGRRSRSSTPQPPPVQRAPMPPSSSSKSNPVPGPGRPASPSAQRSTSSRSKRGTSGRVRSGRKRRRK